MGGRSYLHTAQAEANRQELRELLDQLGGQDAMTDEEALKLAYDELQAARHARRQD